jgi:TonB family C-terminal domain
MREIILALGLFLISICGYSQNKINVGGKLYEIQSPNQKNYVVKDNGDTVCIQVFPEFKEKGGINEYFRTNLRFPSSAIRDHAQGIIIIGFYITKNGEIDSVRVVKSIRKDLDNEAIRVIKNMPKWKPSTVCGKPVGTSMTQSINFGSKSLL